MPERTYHAPLAYLHIDTGMTRLGLLPDDLERVATSPDLHTAVRFGGALSHLACADDRDNAMNAAQRDAFRAAVERLEPVTGPLRASLANSAGIFLGPDYHFDLVRPGAALFGLAPRPDLAHELAPVAHLYARIVQVQSVTPPRTVGYGAGYAVDRPQRLATVAAGYADGYPRAAAGSRVRAWLGDHSAPIVGRISMDLITIDVTAIAGAAVRPGAFVELMGAHTSADELGGAAGTIGYEILARLGSRHHRIYRGGATVTDEAGDGDDG